MKKILSELIDHRSLTKETAHEVLVNLATGKFNLSQTAAFMTVYMMRSITVEELQGFRDAMLELCLPAHFDQPVMDVCGTGGDGKNTINLSTLSTFVVAAAGQPVAKHGNYGVSSACGSSNLLEYFGYKFTNNMDELKRSLDRSNICFMHAPLFHPALKIVGPIRKNLGVRTFFNMLGPMVNPAKPAYQLVGVYNLEMARIYNYLLQQTNKPFTIIHSLDGYDEISLTNDTKVITQAGEKIMTPEQLGKRTVTAEDIYGGNSVEDAAKIFTKIIKGEGSFAQNAVVLANAAMALHCTGSYKNYDEAYNAAVGSLETKKAYQSLQTLISLQ